jgi:uncharacterized protein (DUF2235 family)
MPFRVPFGRSPIQTQEKFPVSTLSDKDSHPSAGPTAYDETVIPSNDDKCPRTLVLCFDGTGDQFNKKVRAYMFSLSAHVLLADPVPLRIPMS